MDINVQIKILESLLRLDENKECADCYSKTPRWASTTFGTFVCLRCSGKHRELQVHITKVKSVNLDKWIPDMVEMYKHVNNAFINSYWEARMPAGFQKPTQSSSPDEVMRFIKDKYLSKRWADSEAKSDPASLYWNDKKKFEKLKQSYQKGGKASNKDDDDEDEEDSEDEEERRRRRKDRKEKKKAKKEKEEKEAKEQIKSKPLTLKTSTQQQKPVEDLFSFDSVPQKSTTANLIDDFSDFQDGQGKTHIVNNQNDGFSDFQAAGQQQQHQQPQSNANPTLNIQNLYNMYNQNPNFVQQQPNNKYSALDALGNIGAGMQQPGAVGAQAFGAGAGIGFGNNAYGVNPAAGFQQTQQQQAFGSAPALSGGFQPSVNPGFGQQQQQQRPDPFGQTNMFAGMNMTINVNQYGASNQYGANPQGQLQQQPTGGFPTQPQFGGIGMGDMNQGFKPQIGPGFGNPAHSYHHQHSAPLLQQNKNMAGVPPNSFYNGLVDLNNLGGQNMGSGNAFGTNGSFGGFQAGSGMGQQQQKKDAFSGLLSGQF